MSALVAYYYTITELAYLNPRAAGGQIGQIQSDRKNWKMTETLAHGYSSESSVSIRQKLSNEYQHDRV